MKFDHVVIAVDDLARASEAFEKAGFNVVSGGKHAYGLSENNLIFFEDGSFIELLKIRNTLTGVLLKIFYHTYLIKLFEHSKKYLLPYRFYFGAMNQKVGLYDFCLLVEKLEDVKSSFKKIAWSKIIRANRVKSDGSILKWNMATPTIFHLPFIRDVFRATTNSAQNNPKPHPNGIKSIAALMVESSYAIDVESIKRFYSPLLVAENSDNFTVHSSPCKIIYRPGVKPKPLKKNTYPKLSLVFNTEDLNESYSFDSIEKYLKIGRC